MNHKILLIDSGVTVQKIVALSLDKTKYSGLFVATKDDAKKQILEQKPSLVLVSDRASGIEWQRFPKEVEAWLGPTGQAPAMVLLASGDVREAKHYQGVLQKPFTPQALQDLLDGLINKERGIEPSAASPSMNRQSEHLNQMFREAEEEEPTGHGFNLNVDLPLDEKHPTMTKAREKLENLWDTPVTPFVAQEVRPQAESVSDLWGGGDNAASLSSQSLSTAKPAEEESQILRTEDSLAYKSLLENQVQQKLESQNLGEIVEKVLARLLPPLVERLVQERLDQLMIEQEEQILVLKV